MIHGTYEHPEGSNKPCVGQLADYIAAAMLMPVDEIYEYLEGSDYKNMSPQKRVAVIHSLCRKYRVNEVAALHGLKEVFELKQLGLTV